MTQEQKAARGTVIIFILSITLLICLCVTTTLAYFAGSQKSNTTLVMGGPVNVSMTNKDLIDTVGQGKLTMNIKGDKKHLLPGIGIDMQAIAKITSSDEDGTPALLRAILEIDVFGIDEIMAREVKRQIRDSLAECLNPRIDGISDGWITYEGDYYYCSANKLIDSEGNEYVAVQPIKADATGTPVIFINGTFQFPYKAYTNDYSNIAIRFTLKFQAIQEKLFNKNDKYIVNSIPNVQHVLDDVFSETR